MGTRYSLLREAVIHLAASAHEQAAYLDHSFKDLTGGKSAEGYGNDELALEFEDSFVAANHMLEHGELTEAEIEALRLLDQLLDCWSGHQHQDFWKRSALFTDERWQAVRACASKALAMLPDETRESEYTRSLANEGHSS